MSDELKEAVEGAAKMWADKCAGKTNTTDYLTEREKLILDALVAAMPDPKDEMCEAALALADKIKGKSFRLVTLQVDDYTTTEGEQSDELARLCVAANAYKQSKGEGETPAKDEKPWRLLTPENTVNELWLPMHEAEEDMKAADMVGLNIETGRLRRQRLPMDPWYGRAMEDIESGDPIEGCMHLGIIRKVRTP